MQVFISWSGPQSKTLAIYLHGWLKTIVQRAEPWLSELDIQAGQRWNSEISKRLEETDFGIICLTPENLNAPWLLFEAGALAKSLNASRVVPLLFGLGKADLSFPLGQFQAVNADREGMFDLISSVNNALPHKRLETELLSTIFSNLWPTIESALESLNNTPNEPSAQNQRSDRDMLEEILDGMRSLQRTSRAPNSRLISENSPSADWEDYYIRGVNLANARGGTSTDSAALQNYAQAIAAAPPSLSDNAFSRLYAYRAAILKRLGRLAEAKNDLRLAQQLASKDLEIEDATYNMACVMAMTGETEDAISQLKELVTRNPDWAPIIAIKPYFKNLSDHPEFKAIIGR